MSSQDFMPSAAYLDVYRSLPALRLFVSYGQNRWQSSVNTLPNMTLNFDFSTPTGSGVWTSLGTDEDNVYINLNGTTDYVNVGPSRNYNPNLIDTWIDPNIRGMTLGTWFKPDSAPRNEHLFGRRVTPSWLCYEFRRDTAGNLTLAISTNGTSFHKLHATTGGPTTDTKWYFVVAQISQAEMRIFVNGEWWSTTSGIPSTIFQTTGASLILGARQLAISSYTSFLDGRMANSFLTASYLPKNMVETLWHVTRKGFRI